MNKDSNDIGLLPALLCLGAFVLGYFFLKDRAGLLGWMNHAVLDFKRSPLILSYLASAVVANLLYFMGLIDRTLGLTAQGAKLRLIETRKEHQRVHFLIYGITFVVGNILGLVLTFSLDGRGARFLSLHQPILTILSSVLTGFLVLALISRISWERVISLFLKFGSKELPPFPIEKGSIVLGSIGDVEQLQSGKRADWVSINRRALNGSILITGSIGSGKTQGTVLPYLQQALTNFEKTPSILAIDPKRTFIEKAVGIIGECEKKTGVKIKTRRITLDGVENFNPVYCERALRESRFLNIAEMVRAAAVNFIGRSFDSPFWEISAFNLMKNCVVYCAASFEYFTLKDIYDTMVRAQLDPLADELKTARDKKIESDVTTLRLAQDYFDDEEKYNIDCAIKYFDQEYRQLDDRVRTGILATSTSFLNQFQEFRAAKIFCPKKEERTILSMDHLTGTRLIPKCFER